VSGNLSVRCYLCGIPVTKHQVGPGQKHPPDDLVPDHVPPKGLFPKPRPDNLIKVPCCFACNNKHSGFDERLRMVAAMPFDRNEAGQRILHEKVAGKTLAKGRQIHFAAKLIASKRAMPKHPELIKVTVDTPEFAEGMIRITKGLLFALHPGFDYYKSIFWAQAIHPQPFDAQLKLMAGLKKQGQHFERGQRVFRCWRSVEASTGVGCWMLVFYECLGFFVFHRNGSEPDCLKP
jgi:hypothetical protein